MAESNQIGVLVIPVNGINILVNGGYITVHDSYIRVHGSYITLLILVATTFCLQCQGIGKSPKLAL